MMRYKTAGICFLLSLSWFSLFSSPTQAKTRKFGYSQSVAVLIGLNHFAHLPSGKYALKTIEGMEKFLKKQGFTKIIKVTGKNVTRKKIKKLLTEELPGTIKKNSRVLVLYTGRMKIVRYENKLVGYTNKVEQAFLTTYDARKRGVGKLMIFEDFMDWVGDLPSDHILAIVDGCYSAPGLFKRPRSYGKHHYLNPLGENYVHLIEGDLVEKAKNFSRLILTAGRTGDKQYKEAVHGMRNLIGHFIWGVDTGIADYDNNGIISFMEIGRYVEREVYREAQQIQRPLYGSFTGDQDGEFLFTSGKSPEKKKLVARKTVGSLSVYVNVKGAQISIDSKRILYSGKIGVPVKASLFAGKHKIEVTADDYQTFSKTINMPENGIRTIKVKLKLKSGEEIGAMVHIPASTFVFGGSKEGIEGNDVSLNKFYIGKYEVTNREYLQFVKATGRPNPPCIEDKCFKGNNKPVVCITLKEAQAYTIWKSKVTGKRYRLPTEAEWERAAKGTGDYLYPWGNGSFKEGKTYKANFESGIEKDPTQCTAGEREFLLDKTKEGIYGMAGNVSEWTADWYGPLVPDFERKGPINNPQGPAQGKKKVVRGGSWLMNEQSLLNSFRKGVFPINSSSDIGFRLVREP